MSALLWALGALGIGALFVIGGYNRLVTQRQRIGESWSNVDTELKRRHDLIPNLVEVVKGYAAHEKTLLEDLARVRALGERGEEPAPGRIDAEQRLGQDAARALVAVAEAYPELKASDQFLRLQRNLSETEDRIQAARRFYNANIRDYNNSVEQFPSNLIARGFDFKTRGYLELDDARDRTPPTVRP